MFQVPSSSQQSVPREWMSVNEIEWLDSRPRVNNILHRYKFNHIWNELLYVSFLSSSSSLLLSLFSFSLVLFLWCVATIVHLKTDSTQCVSVCLVRNATYSYEPRTEWTEDKQIKRYRFAGVQIYIASSVFFCVCVCVFVAKSACKIHTRTLTFWNGILKFKYVRIERESLA